MLEEVIQQLQKDLEVRTKVAQAMHRRIRYPVCDCRSARDGRRCQKHTQEYAHPWLVEPDPPGVMALTADECLVIADLTARVQDQTINLPLDPYCELLRDDVEGDPVWPAGLRGALNGYSRNECLIKLARLGFVELNANV